MRSGLMLLVLAMSLLFNVFFAAGYVQARTRAEQAAAATVTTVAARELALDADQQAMFHRLHAALEEEESVLGDGLALARQELRQELERPEPDVRRVAELAAQCDELAQQLRAARAQRFREFVRTLSPEQCHRLSDRMRRSRRHHEMQRRLLEKFDENGNGVLDPAENEKARVWLDERRREHARRRSDFLKRYDADGDGQLSEAEREAARNDRK